jgi:predicted nucleic acid-binding protein
LIYLRDGRDLEKQRRASEWIAALARRQAIVISPQVVNEFCNAVRRKFPDQRLEDVRKFVVGLRRWCSAPNTFDTSLHGLSLHATDGFQFYDGCLLAAALAANCDFFLSEDMQDGRLVEGMTIVNPFAWPCEAFLAAL